MAGDKEIMAGDEIGKVQNTPPSVSWNGVAKLLVSINEAAAVLGIGRSLVYYLVQTGELPSVKIGRARRVPLKALEEFIARRLNEHD